MPQSDAKEGGAAVLSPEVDGQPSELLEQATLSGKPDLDKSSDLEEDDYEAGIRMRDLTESEVHQFPGLKRERWW
jgi:hypothetical protein